mmetsp:Transcript_89051/g.251314  ORF Transcript_89051/g.251314 Transcript_89051/m.251314 type:complete len:351 (-) Transcript_89051:330-1382(-)
MACCCRPVTHSALSQRRCSGSAVEALLLLFRRPQRSARLLQHHPLPSPVCGIGCAFAGSPRMLLRLCRASLDDLQKCAAIVQAGSDRLSIMVAAATGPRGGCGVGKIVRREGICEIVFDAVKVAEQRAATPALDGSRRRAGGVEAEVVRSALEAAGLVSAAVEDRAKRLEPSNQHTVRSLVRPASSLGHRRPASAPWAATFAAAAVGQQPRSARPSTAGSSGAAGRRMPSSAAVATAPLHSAGGPAGGSASDMTAVAGVPAVPAQRCLSARVGGRAATSGGRGNTQVDLAVPLLGAPPPRPATRPGTAGTATGSRRPPSVVAAVQRQRAEVFPAGQQAEDSEPRHGTFRI